MVNHPKTIGEGLALEVFLHCLTEGLDPGLPQNQGQGLLPDLLFQSIVLALHLHVITIHPEDPQRDILLQPRRVNVDVGKEIVVVVKEDQEGKGKKEVMILMKMDEWVLCL